MRVPISWLRQFVTSQCSTEQLADRLTIAGIEVEAIDQIGIFNRQVVVASVLATAPVPGSSSGYELTLDVGQNRRRSTLCTAPSAAELAPGSKLAVALPGARIVAPGDSFDVAQVETVTRQGIESDCVALSQRELGIGPDHTDLWILDPSCQVGESVLQDQAGEPEWEADEVIELAILANIARCQSIRGVAREVAAITQSSLNEEIETTAVDFRNEPFDASQFDDDLCRRFTRLVVEGVDVGPSPRWMQRRLRLAGISAINNVVDAANYVMVELGQPMHTYDMDQLSDAELGVRRARSGDRLHVLTQLDDAEPMAIPEGLAVVVSDDQPVAIAGVVGGTATAVSAETNTILIESANFDLIQIRKAQSAVKFSTESSSRFSRGADPALTTLAIERFLHLLSLTCKELRLGQGYDYSIGDERIRRTIPLNIAESNAALGVTLEGEVYQELLARVKIESELDETGQELIAIATSARGDIAAPCDLLEEAARLYGYDRLPATMPLEPIPTHPRNNHYHVRERARDALVIAGLQEIMTYSLTSPEQENKIRNPDDANDVPYVRLLNPISSDRTVMRRSLLPELLLCMQRNLRYVDSCRLFEIGQIFLPELGSNDLPQEPYRLAIGMVGPVEPKSMHRPNSEQMSFFDASEAVFQTVDHLHIEGVTLKTANHFPFSPSACAAVVRGDRLYGHVGMLHARVARLFGLEGREVACADLDLEALIEDSQRFFVVSELLQQPSIATDISVIVKQQLPVAELCQIVRETAGDLLREIEVFDVYMGEGVPDDHKAVGIRYTLNAGDRTLTVAEDREVFHKVIKQLGDQFNAKLRT